MSKKYKIIITSIIIGMCFFTSFFFLYSVNKITDIYIEHTKSDIMKIKKSFLKDTVNNLFREIDAERELQREYYEKIIKKQDVIMKEKMKLPEDEFKERLIKYFSDNANVNYWYLLIWDKSQNKEIYDSKELVDGVWDGNDQNLNVDLAVYRQVNVGDRIIIYGISKDYIDESVKNKIADKIRISQFDEDSYIWVNEVINYEGGQDYAIRRVHPNLPETEGTYLSTTTTDIKGDHPYEEELEGIRKDGEVFFTYYFKKLNSDVISEKLTYAKLYKDFDWIIAMGVHLDEVQTYIDNTRAEDKELTRKLTFLLVSIFFLILSISYVFIILTNKWHYKHMKKVMELEINQDTLTKACSRRCGTSDLIRCFKDFKSNGDSPAIMMLDLDFFKEINDTYGHDVGDQVLKEVVRIVYQAIRNSDKLIRWGGDEFVGIFYGLKKENCIDMGQKILDAISHLQIKSGNEVISVTLSIGFSYYKEDDIDYMDVIRRADKALYESKLSGRNRVRMLD